MLSRRSISAADFGERGLDEVAWAVEADAGLAAEGVATPFERLGA